MKKLTIKILLICSLMIFMAQTISAVEIEYIGSLESDLVAPTSITVDGNSLTVLEPFSKEMKVFTPNGLLQHKLHITGDANSISKLSDNEYLYCDLDARIIAYANLGSDEQSDYFENIYEFNLPIDIIIDADFSILDADEKQIIIFDKQKVLKKIIMLQKDDGTQISYPNSFAKNSSNGNFYLFDQLKSEIWIFKPDGTYLKKFGAYGGSEGEITRGGEISVNSDGLVFITDRYQNRVSIFSADGRYLDMIPNQNVDVSFNTPLGLTIDENNLLYVVSTESSKIQMFHIAASASETNAVSMEQLRPESDAVVSIDNLEFFASATTTLLTEIKLFDFEIYAQDNVEEIAQSSYNVVAKQTYDSLKQVTSYTAHWLLTEKLLEETDFQWRTRVHTLDSVYDWSTFQMFSTSSLPVTFSLSQNYPNPFNPTTKIQFSLAKESDVQLEIFNLNGQLVSTLINNSLPTGEHSIIWAGKNKQGQQAATGIYFYRLTAGEFVETKKMVLLK